MAEEVKTPSSGIGGGAAFAPVLGSVASSLLQNAANYALAQGQRSHDVRMWQMQNEYNSPRNQVARLRAAGLNPGLNSNIGTGENAVHAGGQTAPVTDFSPIAQGLRDSVDLYQQRRMQDAQIAYQNQNTYNLAIRNRYENTRQILELDKLISDKNTSDSQRRFYEQERQRLIKENSWIDQRNSSQIALNDAQAGQARAAEVESQTRAEYQKIVNLYAPKNQQLVLSNLMATYSQIMSAAASNNAAAVSSLTQAALNRANEQIAKTHGAAAKLDYQTQRKIQQAVIRESFAKVQQAEAEASISRAGAKYGTLWTKFSGFKHEQNVYNITNPSSKGGVR